MQNLYTIDEAASYLNLNKQTLRNWEKTGKISCVRGPKNNYRMFTKDELDKVKLTSKPPMVKPSTLQSNQNEFRVKSDSDVKRLISKAHRIIRDNDGNSSIIERFDELTKLIIVYLGVKKISNTNDLNIDQFSNFIKMKYYEIVSDEKLQPPSEFKTINLSNDCIYKVFQHLEKFSIDENSSDIKGLIYEEMLRDTFEKGENQQFFTPNSIVEFMSSVISTLKSGSVCDPASGTGGFLVKLLKGNNSFTDYTALEIDKRLSWASKVNLKLHGCKNFQSIHLPEGGSLGKSAESYFGKFDAIITNPPFGSDFSDIKQLNQFVLGKQKTSRRRGVLFIEQCINMLKSDGIVSLIIDDGVLNHPSNSDVRELILRETDVLAVISLPVSAFMPYASVEASILILKKKGRSEYSTETFFAKVENIGRKSNGDEDFLYDENGVERLNNDLPSILKEWNLHKKGERISNQTNIYTFNILTDYNQSKSNRLDFPNFHPSRQLIKDALIKHRPSLTYLSEVCTEVNYSIIPSKDLQDQNILYTGLAHIVSDSEHYTQTNISANSIKSSVKQYENGDVLFSKMRPNLRKCVHITHELSGYCSSECVVLRPIHEKITGRLLAALLRSDFVYGQIIHLVTGIGRPRISIKDLRSILLPLPKLGDLNKYELYYEERMSEARKLKEKAEMLLKKGNDIESSSKDHLVDRIFS